MFRKQEEKQCYYVKCMNIFGSHCTCEEYLGPTKSNSSNTFFVYERLENLFKFYKKLKRHSLYFSTLLYDYSSNIIVIKF